MNPDTIDLNAVFASVRLCRSVPWRRIASLMLRSACWIMTRSSGWETISASTLI
jgi:hypothetical protein